MRQGCLDRRAVHHLEQNRREGYNPLIYKPRGVEVARTARLKCQAFCRLYLLEVGVLETAADEQHP